MMAKTNWDWAGDYFTAKEISAAIQGISIEDVRDDDIVMRRIDDAYQEAAFFHEVHFQSALDLDIFDDIEPTALQCSGMDKRGFLYQEWMQRRLFQRLDQQKFARIEVARWIEHLALHSVYAFLKPPKDSAKTGASGGGAKSKNNGSQLLRSLAKKYYMTYPNDSNATQVANLLLKRFSKELKDITVTEPDRIIADEIRKLRNSG